MRSAPARAAVLGVLFAAFVTLPGLGTGTLWDNSETAYGEVAREIGLRGDWVVMHLNGQPWFVQPPLWFWIAALSVKLFGATAFALRLPAAAATIAMGGAVGYATARIATQRAGVIAAVVLSTSLMQAILGRLAIMDALLDLTVAAATLWWFRALEPLGDPHALAPGKRGAAFVLGAAALALGTLAKGPVAPVIVGLVVLIWAFWEGRASGGIVAPPPRAALAAALVLVAIAAPWFVALALRVGPGGLAELIGHYTVGRYTGVIENQRGPFWYYVPALILGFFPWVAFVPAALAHALRLARHADAAFARLALVWTAVPFVFFSCAQTKLPNYIALVLPALAIVTALWFERVAEGAARRAALASAATIPLFVGACAFAVNRFAASNRLDGALGTVMPALVELGIGMLAGSVATLAALAVRRTAGGAPFVLAVTAGVLVLFIAVVAEPYAEPLKPMPRFARVIDAERRGGDVVAVRGISGGNALVFYTLPGVVAIPDEDAAFARLICADRRSWVATRAADLGRLEDLASARGATATVASRTPRAVLLRVDGGACRSVGLR